MKPIIEQAKERLATERLTTLSHDRFLIKELVKELEKSPQPTASEGQTEADCSATFDDIYNICKSKHRSKSMHRDCFNDKYYRYAPKKLATHLHAFLKGKTVK